MLGSWSDSDHLGDTVHLGPRTILDSSPWLRVDSVLLLLSLDLDLPINM